MKKNIVKILISIFVVAIIYFVLIELLIFSESSNPDSSIENLSDAIWYSVVTLTTVGYGDLFPVTNLGKLIGYVFVIGSLGILGFLIGKVSSIIREISERRKLGYNGTNYFHHTIVIGWNNFSKIITEQLVNADQQIAIITNDRNKLELIKKIYNKRNVYILFADYYNFDLIRKSNIDNSTCVFINFGDDTEKLVYLINCKKSFNKNVKFGVLISNYDLKTNFVNIGVDFVFNKNEMASNLIASHIFEPFVAKYLEDLLASAKSNRDFDIQEYKVVQKNPFIGYKYQDVFKSIKEDYGSILIGLVKINNGIRELYKNPSSDNLKIEINDFLILITNGEAAQKISNNFFVNEGSQ